MLKEEWSSDPPTCGGTRQAVLKQRLRRRLKWGSPLIGCDTPLRRRDRGGTSRMLTLSWLLSSLLPYPRLKNTSPWSDVTGGMAVVAVCWQVGYRVVCYGGRECGGSRE